MGQRSLIYIHVYLIIFLLASTAAQNPRPGVGSLPQPVRLGHRPVRTLPRQVPHLLAREWFSLLCYQMLHECFYMNSIKMTLYVYDNDY